MNRIYLDNQSTTRMSTPVVNAISHSMQAGYANPASQHEFGRLARQQLESCRQLIGDRLGLGRNDRCLFTSGGTESNNLALLGHFPQSFDGQRNNVVCSAIEHPSILGALDHLKKCRIEIRLIDADKNGSVDPAKFKANIDHQTRLVICMLANNETGVIQPVEEVASICRSQGVPFHVDAVQAVGKIAFHFSELNCSSATVSAHKIHGPPGMGALLVNEHCKLSPLMHGGFQQDGLRPGTENIPLATGFSKAIELAILKLEDNMVYLSGLRDRFESLLLSRFPQITINGLEAQRLPNASNISFSGIDRQQFILAADMAGLACSTGSACSSGSSQPSHVLTSMGCDKQIVNSSIRFGFSTLNRPEEIDFAVEQISRIISSKKP